MLVQRYNSESRPGFQLHSQKNFFKPPGYLFWQPLKVTCTIVIRNGKIVRNHGSNRSLCWEPSASTGVGFLYGAGLIIVSIRKMLKASVCYFFSNFYFFYQMIGPQKYEKCFLFYRKSSFRSRDIQIFVIFSLLFYTFQIQKGKWKWNNLWCHKLSCINLQI